MTQRWTTLPLVLALSAGSPAPLAAQTARTISLEAGLTVSVLEHAGLVGPGVRLAYREPRTHNVDVGLEVAYFDAGEGREVFTETGAGGATEIRTRRERLRYGYVAVAARRHTTGGGPLHAVLTATLGMYRVWHRLTSELQTESGVPLRPTLLLRDEAHIRPGVGAGAGVIWSLGNRFRLEGELRLHAAIHDGFPAALFSVGLSRVLGAR